MMNRFAIRPQVVPNDGNWGFDVSEHEAMLPAGTVDKKRASLPYKSQLPKWEELDSSTRARYQKVIKYLADKYPTDNLLLFTHGEGVGVALSTFLKNAEVHAVEYCAYVELRRPIFQKGQSFTSGEFNLLTHTGQTGISWTLKETKQISKC